MLAPLPSRLITTGISAGTALLMAATVPGAQAEPAAPNRPVIGVSFPPAVKPQIKYTRTFGQAKGSVEITFRDDRMRPTGFMSGDTTQTQQLNSKSNNWKRSFSVRITKATGVARSRPVSLTVKVSCGKGARSCKPSAQVTKTVALNRTANFDFTITSYGKKIHNHKPMLVLTFTSAPAVPVTTSAPAMGTVRCDSEKATNGGKRGCVYPAVVPNFSLSRTNPKWGAMAKHIYDAQRALDGKPGYGKPLHRTTPAQAKKNRQKTCPSSLTRPRGKQCDEYPYASAKEGGGVLGKPQSRKMIAAEHNRQGGNQLGHFYNAHRILPGDTFYSRVN
ncbi:NucA/NucB deoxyribonuclease domain-containing protein [Streptomyces zaomyceticus]|uniref:NucA/NucB deoxyribonuclease domain-containing protein n=1 Tax=Streptomyces zaomyceticus TaxID=68286 RepID=UPI00344A520C